MEKRKTAGLLLIWYASYYGFEIHKSNLFGRTNNNNLVCCV